MSGGLKLECVKGKLLEYSVKGEFPLIFFMKSTLVALRYTQGLCYKQKRSEKKLGKCD